MGTPLVIASALYNQYSSNKALEAQGKANVQTARNYITSMNYSLQNLEQERRDAFDATIDDLEKNKLQGYRQKAGVVAAVNEGLQGGGRTAQMLKRSSQADINRTVTSIKDNYRRKSNEIDLNREATVKNAQRSISSIQEVKKPSFLSTLVSLGTAYVGARTVDEQINGMRHKAGIIGHGNSSGALYPNRATNWVDANWYDSYEDSFDINSYSFAPTLFNYDIQDYMPVTNYRKNFDITDSPYVMTNWWRR